jgi:flagellin-like hook-associated protein FlgL
VSVSEQLYEHIRHPWRDERDAAGPVKVADQHPSGNAVARFNTRLALVITRVVGSMWCAYAFALFDLISLPAAIQAGTAAIVSWIAQTFLQLVLLSVIMVGQNVQADAADKRSEATYKDAEAILHGLDQAAAHLAAQDQAFGAVQDHLAGQDETLATLIERVTDALAALEPRR